MTKFDNPVAQKLFDQGRYCMMDPIKERINVSKDPYDREYRQHVFNGLRRYQRAAYSYVKAGLMNDSERFIMFCAWKRYGGKVLSNVHTERRGNNAARHVARVAANLQNDEQIIIKVIKK